MWCVSIRAIRVGDWLGKCCGVRGRMGNGRSERLPSPAGAEDHEFESLGAAKAGPKFCGATGSRKVDMSRGGHHSHKVTTPAEPT